MLYSFLQTVKPYKSLTIYEQYYETAKQIHVYGNRKITLKLYRNLVVHLHLAILQLVFYFVSNMSAHLRILLVDFFWAIGLSSTFNFLLSLQACMVIYFYLVFYFNDNLHLNKTMRSVLFPQTIKKQFKMARNEWPYSKSSLEDCKHLANVHSAYELYSFIR